MDTGIQPTQFFYSLNYSMKKKKKEYIKISWKLYQPMLKKRFTKTVNCLQLMCVWTVQVLERHMSILDVFGPPVSVSVGQRVKWPAKECGGIQHNTHTITVINLILHLPGTLPNNCPDLWHLLDNNLFCFWDSHFKN